MIPERQALDALNWLEDECIVKLVTTSRDWLVLACRGVRLGATDDTMLMSYVMDAGKGAATSTAPSRATSVAARALQ